MIGVLHRTLQGCKRDENLHRCSGVGRQESNQILIYHFHRYLRNTPDKMRSSFAEVSAFMWNRIYQAFLFALQNLYGLFILFPSTDANDFIQLGDKNLSIADFIGHGILANGFDDSIHLFVGRENFYFYFW